MSNIATLNETAFITITKKNGVKIERTEAAGYTTTNKVARQDALNHTTVKWWANGMFAPMARECSAVFGKLFDGMANNTFCTLDLQNGRVIKGKMTNREAWLALFAGLNEADTALNKKGNPAPFKGEKRMWLDAFNHAILVGEMAIAAKIAAATESAINTTAHEVGPLALETSPEASETVADSVAA